MDNNNEEVPPFRHFESTAGRLHHFYISEIIGPPKDYVDMIHIIRTAQPNDIIYIYLNTPGGRIDTGAQIISTMHSSGAKIITVAEGEVCSLGTMIFLCGDEMILQDHSLFMIHNHSGGATGKGHEYLAAAEGTSKWFEEMAKIVYTGFLTDDEFRLMMNGKDYWFTAEETRNRLVKYSKYLEKKAKKAKKELKKAQKEEK